jgi:hypothetical protein
MQYVADLMSVAVDSDRLIAQCADQEVRDPALVFGAELARPVNTALAEDGCAQTKGVGVIENILIGGSLRTTVRGTEGKRAGLIDAALTDIRVRRNVAVRRLLHLQISQIAVDLVSAGEDKRRLGRQATDRFQNGQSTLSINDEVGERVGQAGGDGDLCGEMYHAAGLRHGGLDGNRIAQVAGDGM